MQEEGKGTLLNGTATVRQVLQDTAPTGIISLGLIALLWLSASLFVAVMDALNRIMDVQETRPFWKVRLTAMLMTLSFKASARGNLATGPPKGWAEEERSRLQPLLARVVERAARRTQDAALALLLIGVPSRPAIAK